MRLAETTWEHQPKAGWDAFQAARTRVGDVVWADSQLHNIGPQRSTDTAPTCQLCDATD